MNEQLISLTEAEKKLNPHLLKFLLKEKDDPRRIIFLIVQKNLIKHILPSPA